MHYPSSTTESIGRRAEAFRWKVLKHFFARVLCVCGGICCAHA